MQLTTREHSKQRKGKNNKIHPHPFKIILPAFIKLHASLADNIYTAKCLSMPYICYW